METQKSPICVSAKFKLCAPPKGENKTLLQRGSLALPYLSTLLEPCVGCPFYSPSPSPLKKIFTTHKHSDTHKKKHRSAPAHLHL